MPWYQRPVEFLGNTAVKGLAKVGIKVGGEKVSTTGAKALAKMAEEGKGTFTKLTEKLAKERGVSSVRFGEDAVAKQTRRMAESMAKKVGPHVGNYGVKVATKAGRQALRPVVSTVERASSIAARRSIGSISRAATQASHSMIGSLGARYGQQMERILSKMNPVQRFFFNFQVQLSNMLSRLFGINTGFMKQFADRMGRLALDDTKLSTRYGLRTGEGITSDGLKGSFKDIFESNLSKLVNSSSRGGHALVDVAKKSVDKSYERLTGEKLLLSASKAGEGAAIQTVKEGAENMVKNGIKEGTEQAARQEVKNTVEQAVEHASEKAAAHAGEGAAADGGKKAADTIVHEWKNVAKDDLKVGDHIRLVDKEGKALDGSEVVIKDIKDGKFTVESVKSSGLIPNQTFEKNAIQRLEETLVRDTSEQGAKQGLRDGAEITGKEGLENGAKEAGETLEKKATKGGLFDLTEDFQKKMNEAETFQWKVNKMMDKSLAKQKEAIDKLYEAAKAETNPSSAAKMLSGATEKETALSLKIAENLQKQKELIEGVDRRVAQEAELAARKEAEKAAEKANPFELPEKLMNRLKSRPKELAQWNMNKAAWEGLQEQRRAVDKLYEAAAKTTNLRESAKLTSEAAEKSAALQKQAAEIMQKHVDLAGRLNKTLFRQGAEKVVQNPKQLLGWSGAILGSGMAVSGIASGKGALDPFFKTLFGQQYEQNGLGGVIVKTVIGEKNQKAAADKLSQLGQKTGNAVAENAPKVATEVGRIYNGIADDAAAINQEAGNAYNNIKGAVTGLYHGNQQISDGQGGYYDSTTQQYEGVPQNGSSAQYAMGLAKNTMDSFSGGNVSKMDLGSLLAASLLGFGRFGLIGKAIGAVMAGSTIHNINKRGQSTQQVQQSQVYAPSQSQAVRQTQEYNASVYQHPEVSFDESESTQHSRHI